MRPFGSELSGVRDLEMKTADNIGVKISGRKERLGLRVLGIPHMGLRMRASVIGRLAGDVKEKSVLNAGCGIGMHSVSLSGKGAHVFGADMSREKVRASVGVRESLSIAHLDCVSDVTALPYADSSFDVVLCSEVLEHVKDDGRAMKEFARVLKAGGTLIITVPEVGFREPGGSDFGHVRTGYSRAGVLAIAKASGMKLERFVYYGRFFGRFSWRANRALFSSKILTALTFYPLFLVSKLDALLPFVKGHGIVAAMRKEGPFAIT